MAYDSAVAEGVPQPLIDLYVAQCIKDDLAWYTEEGLTREGFAAMENTAFETVFPLMHDIVEQMGAEPFVRAPIVSDATWGQFVQSLETFEPLESPPETRSLDHASPFRNKLFRLSRQVLLVSPPYPHK